MIDLDPATLRTAPMASGRTVVQADGMGWHVLAVVTTLPSGRPLIDSLTVAQHGRTVVRHNTPHDDAWARAVREHARRAVVLLLAPRGGL